MHTVETLFCGECIGCISVRHQGPLHQNNGVSWYRLTMSDNKSKVFYNRKLAFFSLQLWYKGNIFQALLMAVQSTSIGWKFVYVYLYRLISWSLGLVLFCFSCTSTFKHRCCAWTWWEFSMCISTIWKYHVFQLVHMNMYHFN